MKTTFLNCGKSERKEFRKEGRKHLEGRASDFKFFMDNGSDLESTSLNTDTEENLKEAERLYSEHGNFYEYGLAIDYVTPGTFNNRAGYLRYLLSYGGPSEEIRFYFTPNAREAYKIEFVYLQWGTGVGFNVTGEDWAQWLFDWFNEVGTVQAELTKAFEND